jgi:hypothetical protein
MIRRIRHTAAVLVLLVSLFVLAWGSWPIRYEDRLLRVAPSQMSLPADPSYTGN